jgi:hypothetical protein
MIRVSDSINQRPKKRCKKRRRVNCLGFVADVTKAVEEDEVEDDQQLVVLRRRFGLSSLTKPFATETHKSSQIYNESKLIYFVTFFSQLITP